MTVVIATANADKLRELEDLLADTGVTLAPIGRWKGYTPPPETGETLRENAEIKARTAAGHTGLPAIADDTGLDVAALGGLPGVRAARFAGEHATYADNRRKLLSLLAGVPPDRRQAVFRTVVALAFPDGECHTVEGQCVGEITDEERGEGGFGYDPVFLVRPLGLTYAEMDAAAKHAVSHRGAALARLRVVMADLARARRL